MKKYRLYFKPLRGNGAIDEVHIFNLLNDELGDDVSIKTIDVDSMGTYAIVETDVPLGVLEIMTSKTIKVDEVITIK